MTYVVRVAVLSGGRACFVADPAVCPAPYTTLLRWARRFRSEAEAAEAARRVPEVYGATPIRLGGALPPGAVALLLPPLLAAPRSAGASRCLPTFRQKRLPRLFRQNPEDHFFPGRSQYRLLRPIPNHPLSPGRAPPPAGPGK
jgi:hypothetical protein